MNETPIELRSSHREETDGSHTVTVQISGIPSLGFAQGISEWMRNLIQENAYKIGRLEKGHVREQ